MVESPTGTTRHIVMASPDHYEVCYTINPWMRPDAWSADPAAARDLAGREWTGLAERLRAAGLTVEVVPAFAGLPDMVFPANAAIVLDRRALLARFRYPERRGEEARFLEFFQGLRARGLLDEVAQLPEGMFQEGAGDCIWDAGRSLMWAAWGPRSSLESHDHIARFFGQKVVSLELVSDRFYHLDTCFCVLSGGEVLYYPPALSPASQDLVASHVPQALRITATAAEAAAFSLNAVSLGRDLFMAEPPPRLRAMLEERGYSCQGVPLSSFLLSGGAAYCMTLRLDLRSH
jgi:N-dimethylarginine dimethylaminohydrolase